MRELFPCFYQRADGKVLVGDFPLALERQSPRLLGEIAVWVPSCPDTSRLRLAKLESLMTSWPIHFAGTKPTLSFERL